MIKVITKTPQELEYFGKRVAQFLSPGDFFALDGELGAGKTLFTKGIAEGLDVEEEMTSPTFTIIHEYDSGRLPLYHMDVYRLKQPEEMYDLGYEEYFYGEGVTVVEWASMIPSLLPEEYIEILIVSIPEGRELSLIPHGTRYETLIEAVTGCDYSKYR